MLFLGQDHGDGHPLMPQHGAEPSLSPPLGGSSVCAIAHVLPPGFGQRGSRPHERSNLRATQQKTTCLILVWWLWWSWWLWSRRDVYDMSLTICHNSPAPNYGGRVPVDTAPGPVPVYRAPTTAPVELAPPAQQGRRSPCSATGNLHGQRDHGDQPLRHDREDDDL